VTVAIQTTAPPIRENEAGALRVGNSRVLLKSEGTVPCQPRPTAWDPEVRMWAEAPTGNAVKDFREASSPNTSTRRKQVGPRALIESTCLRCVLVF
jgi:hypothetical protein